MAGFVVKKAASLREQVVDAVFHDLQAGIISPGERITEEGLARRLNVSRTPIREALAQLSHQGVISPRAGGGFVVPFPTPAEVRDIIAVRKLLEPAALRMAAEEFTPTHVAAISRAISREAGSATTKTITRFMKANEEFREAIFHHISNRALMNAIIQFNSHLHLIRQSTLDNLDIRKQIIDRQIKIRDAIEQHNADLSARLWMEYLDLSEKALIEAIVNWPAEGQSSRQRKVKPNDDATE